jgi:hypothetical protein
MVHKTKKKKTEYRVVSFPVQILSLQIFGRPFKELTEPEKQEVGNNWSIIQKQLYEGKSYKRYGRQKKLW